MAAQLPAAQLVAAQPVARRALWQPCARELLLRRRELLEHRLGGAERLLLKATSTSRTTTNPWYPELLTDLAPYARAAVHGLEPDQRQQQPAGRLEHAQAEDGEPQSEPVAFEWQIDLCNRTKKDYWLNIPHESSVAVRGQKLAQLVSHRARSVAARLPRMVERGLERLASRRTPTPRRTAKTSGFARQRPGGRVPRLPVGAPLSRRSRRVFGKGSPRLVKVLAGQAAYTGPCTNDVTAFADTTINPNRTKPDFYAVAPYFSGTTVAAVSGAIAGIQSGLQSNATCAAWPPCRSSPTRAAPTPTPRPTVRRCRPIPACTTFTPRISTRWSRTICRALHAVHAHGSVLGAQGEDSDATLASPKYQGLLDWLAAHP